MTRYAQQFNDADLSSGEYQIQRQQQQKQRQQHLQRQVTSAGQELPDKQHQSRHNPVSEGLQVGQLSSDQ